MKALVITRLSGPDAIELKDVPEPQPGPNQVLVEVKAGGVNFADVITSSGGYPGLPNPPFIAGREFAGRAVEAGERVMGYAQLGAYAERFAAPRPLLWPVPAAWTDQEAAAFPVNFFTAYFAYWKAGLVETAPHASPRVLIHAVAGGVGTAAVQIGKILGIEMYGTSSSHDKLEKVQQLGLQHPINYKEHDYEECIRELTGGAGVDAAFEMLGAEHVAKTVRCLTDFGRMITYGSATGKPAQLDARLLYQRGTSVHGLWLTQLAKQPKLMADAWHHLSQWANTGKLRPVVGHVLPMSRVADAYKLLLERKNFGKVVLEIQ
jgi:NADPH2:quinone reductase